MDKYYIYCRYEYISNKGNKEFTQWFRTDKEYITEELAKEAVSMIQETSKQIDKSTKLKHEYEIRLLDETLIPQIKLKRPKGRPKKFSNEDLKPYIKTLNKCGQVKVDESDKEFLYNDEEAKKYIQDNIKDKDTKWVRYWYDDNILYMILKDNSEKIYE